MPGPTGTVGKSAFPALGGTAVVLTADPAAAGAAVRAVLDEVAAIDAACSRFRADSELATVNAAAGRTATVGPLFAEALEAALRAAELTGGAVDPTCGARLVALGYDRDFSLIADEPTVHLAGAAPLPGWRSVLWDPSNRRVRIPAGFGPGLRGDRQGAGC